MGCERIDGILYCEVRADGWRYVAYEDDRNNPAVLDKLASLGRNLTLSISGDLISYGDVSADVTIREIHLADGLGGKGYVVFNGPVSEVEIAVDLAVARAADRLVASRVIAQVHREMDENLTSAHRFADRMEPE